MFSSSNEQNRHFNYASSQSLWQQKLMKLLDRQQKTKQLLLYLHCRTFLMFTYYACTLTIINTYILYVVWWLSHCTEWIASKHYVISLKCFNSFFYYISVTALHTSAEWVQSCWLCPSPSNVTILFVIPCDNSEPKDSSCQPPSSSPLLIIFPSSSSSNLSSPRTAIRIE